MSRTLRLFAGAAAMLVVAVGVAVVLKDEPGYEAGRLEISGKIQGLTEYQESRAEEKAEMLSAEAPVERPPAQPVEKTEGKAAPQAERTGEQPAVPSEEKAQVPSSAVAERSVPSGQTTSSVAAVQRHAAPSSMPAMSMEASAGFSSENELDLPASADVFPAASPQAEPADRVEKASQSPRTETSKKAEPSSEAAKEKAVDVKKTSARPDAESATETPPAPKQTVAGRTPSGAQGVSPVKEALAEVRSSVEGTPAAAVEKSSASPAEKPAQRYERVVTSAKFSMKGSLIKLVLQGNAPMVGHYSILGNPDRVVLDLAGNWEITVPRVPSNRLIQAVRVGQHDDKTRIVFDMKTMGRVALVPLNRNSLELSIQ